MFTSLKPKKRIVKHSKKSWRVTDVKDVEHFLEEERLEERLGDPYATRPDESIFVIDKPQKSAEEQNESPTHVTKRSKRDISPLKCHSILYKTTAVKDPLIKRNQVRQKAKKTPTVLAAPLVPKQKQTTETVRTPYDVWSMGSERERKPQSLRIKASDLFPEVKNYLLESTCDRVMDQPKHRLYKPSKLPAVEPADPGQSYNPTFADHQNLLLKAHLVEAAKEEDTKKTMKRVGTMMKGVVAMPTEEHWMSEMSQGLAESDHEDADSGIMEDDSQGSKDRGTRDETKAKTKKQRRKEKKRRMDVIHATESKDKKVKEHDVFRLKSIRKEIEEEAAHTEMLSKKRRHLKDMKPYRQLALGPNKFSPQEIELNFSEEITGSLRTLHTDGDLIVDRFKSLQKRNLIEPRKMQIPKRKYKLKQFAKKSHKIEA